MNSLVRREDGCGMSVTWTAPPSSFFAQGPEAGGSPPCVLCHGAENLLKSTSEISNHIYASFSKYEIIIK